MASFPEPADRHDFSGSTAWDEAGKCRVADEPAADRQLDTVELWSKPISRVGAAIS
jgi:hypothetical protein